MSHPPSVSAAMAPPSARRTCVTGGFGQGGLHMSILHMSILAVFTAALCAGDAAQAADGAAMFADKCQVCHQAEGAGVAGVFPRLSGRVSAISASPAGRKFLPTLVLNGMSGKVTVDNRPIVGVMPGFDTMSDADVAKLLTYVARLGGGKAAEFKPGEVAAARASGRQAPAEVAGLRNKLAADKVIP